MPTPIALPGLAQRVAVGESSAYVLLEDGSVVAWGENDEGQLGNGPSGSNKPLGTYPKPSVTPVRVTDLADIIAIEAGRKHAIALRKDGTVWAWGIRDDGAIGDGDAKPAGSLRVVSATAPVAVRGLTGITQIAAGPTHNLALTREGKVMSWGSNSTGELGVGTRATGWTPAEVTGLVEHRRHCRGQRPGYIWRVGRRASGRHALGVGQRQLGADGQRRAQSVAGRSRRPQPAAVAGQGHCRCERRGGWRRTHRCAAERWFVARMGHERLRRARARRDELVRSRASQGAWIDECRQPCASAATTRMRSGPTARCGSGDSPWARAAASCRVTSPLRRDSTCPRRACRCV